MAVGNQASGYVQDWRNRQWDYYSSLVSYPASVEQKSYGNIIIFLSGISTGSIKSGRTSVSVCLSVYWTKLQFSIQGSVIISMYRENKGGQFIDPSRVQRVQPHQCQHCSRRSGDVQGHRSRLQSDPPSE